MSQIPDIEHFKSECLRLEFERGVLLRELRRRDDMIRRLLQELDYFDTSTEHAATAVIQREARAMLEGK